MHLFVDVLFHDPARWAMAVFVMVFSIVLHELGHALVATWEGDPTPKMLGHLTWNPVVHMGWVSLAVIALAGIGWGKTPVNPRNFRHRRWGDVLVSFAGPAVNLLLAVVSAFVLVLGVRHGGMAETSPAAELWLLLMELNVLLFLFNLIPLPPMDGFGVLTGTFDLGDLGARLRQMGMLPLLIAIVIVNSDPFNRLVEATTAGIVNMVSLVL